MQFLYTIANYIFYVLVKIASLKNEKAKKWITGRKKQFDTIKNLTNSQAKTVWVHCASLGEFEQGRPLIEAIKKQYPEKKIMLTFYSPSGYEVMKNYSLADYVFYLPLDTKRNARKFIKYTRPELVFFIKYEYWYNFLSELKKNTIPVYFVSAIFRTDQLFFKWYGKWYRKMLFMANYFFLQNQSSAKMLQSIGVTNYTVSGDTRFDRVMQIVSNVKTFDSVATFVNGSKTIVAGSTWKAEEALLRQYLRNNTSVKAILVPHEIDNGNMQRVVDQYAGIAVKLSDIDTVDSANKQVLIIDCYGILPSLYQYGSIAVIGGGFGVGIHNILEPATFGMPIVFGPNFQKFKEASDLVEKNCAFPINNVEEFNTVINHLLFNAETLQKISDLTSQYIKSNVGATKKILQKVFEQ